MTSPALRMTDGGVINAGRFVGPDTGGKYGLDGCGAIGIVGTVIPGVVGVGTVNGVGTSGGVGRFVCSAFAVAASAANKIQTANLVARLSSRRGLVWCVAMIARLPVATVVGRPAS